MFDSPRSTPSWDSGTDLESVRKSAGELQLEENGGDVTKGDWADNSDSPLMKLPREVSLRSGK